MVVIYDYIADTHAVSLTRGYSWDRHGSALIVGVVRGNNSGRRWRGGVESNWRG